MLEVLLEKCEVAFKASPAYEYLLRKAEKDEAEMAALDKVRILIISPDFFYSLADFFHIPRMTFSYSRGSHSRTSFSLLQQSTLDLGYREPHTFDAVERTIYIL